MASTEKYLLGTQSTLMSTSLNSLANNTLVIGSAYDNTQGQSGDGYTLCEIELSIGSTAGSITSGTGVALWFIKTNDGTNYEDGGAGVEPARAPDCIIPLRAVSTAQLVIVTAIAPAGLFKPLLKNDGTGQTFNSSGNTLKIRPFTRQMV